MLGLSLATVDEWYERWFGGLLETGTVAHLAYARKLMMAPVAIVGQAVGAALFGFAGRLTDEVLGVTVVAIPAMILGWSIGLRVRGHVAPVAFRRLILGLLVLAALATMVAALS